MSENRVKDAQTMTGTPVPLPYATPSVPPLSEDPAVHATLRFARRIVFALGAGLFFFGFGNGWVRYKTSDVGTFMGWGAALMALTMQWGWRRDGKQ